MRFLRCLGLEGVTSRLGVLLALVVVVCSAEPVAAETFLVDPGGSAGWSSIQSAIAAASDGDTIRVEGIEGSIRLLSIDTEEKLRGRADRAPRPRRPTRRGRTKSSHWTPMG